MKQKNLVEQQNNNLLRLKLSSTERRGKKQEGKARKFVQEVWEDIKALIDAVLEKGRKRKDLVVHIEPVTADSKFEDDTPLAFKRVVRKKPKEPKVEAKEQSVRKVTIKLLAQKQAPKATPSVASSIFRRKKSDIDLALENGKWLLYHPWLVLKLLMKLLRMGC